MRKNGRPKHDRLRAMRFALWAQNMPTSALTIRQISGLLGITRSSAQRWRQDWLTALSPAHIEDVPPRRNPSAEPAATGEATTTRS